MKHFEHTMPLETALDRSLRDALETLSDEPRTPEPLRCRTVKRAKETLAQLLEACMQDPRVEVRLRPAFGMASVVAHTDLFSVCGTEHLHCFADLLRQADAVECVPLLDGRLEISLSFKNVFLPVSQ